jgi:hypothetical protein
MRSPTKQDGTNRRVSDRRQKQERRTDDVRAVSGDRRLVEQRGLAESMIDALHDILKWERASERALRAAQADRDAN